MASYLDENGVTRLWSKIKDYVKKYVSENASGGDLTEITNELNTLKNKYKHTTHVVGLTGNGYIYFDPPYADPSYWLIAASNGDWQANTFYVKSVARESNGRGIVFFTGGYPGNAARFNLLWGKLD